MSDFRPPRRGEDTDLLCVEVSAFGTASNTALPKVPCDGHEAAPRQDHAQEEFLRSLLLKMDTYRPRQSSFACMENQGENNLLVAVFSVVATREAAWGYRFPTADPVFARPPCTCCC